MNNEAEVAELNDLPLQEPMLVRLAPGLLSPEGGAPQAEVATLLEAAVAGGAVRSVRVRVPGGPVASFVDGATVEDELAAYRARVESGAVPRPRRKRSAREELLRIARKAIAVRPVRIALEMLCRRPSDYVVLARLTPFGAVQRRAEITALLNLLAERRPRHVLEIGTAWGGTLYLTSRVADPDALLVTVDIDPAHDSTLMRSFARRGQRVELIIGDSTSEPVKSRIESYFPDGVDYAFIDGDHSYEGVRADFEAYSPLVRPGGVIAFHDIVDDNRTRFGVDTGGWAGGVPRFWREIRDRYEHREFIDDPDQDGLGIGVIFWPG